MQFTASSFCHGGGCVEVAFTHVDGELLAVVRDSTERKVQFTIREWIEFLAGVKNGEFEVVGS